MKRKVRHKWKRLYISAKVHRDFKSKADKLGMTVEGASDEALRDWIEKDRTNTDICDPK